MARYLTSGKHWRGGGKDHHNPILVALRRHKWDPYALLLDLDSAWALQFTPQEREHALRVIELLIEVRQTNQGVIMPGDAEKKYSELSTVPYRVIVDNSSVAAFEDFEAAAAHAERVLRAMQLESVQGGPPLTVGIQFNLNQI